MFSGFYRLQYEMLLFILQAIKAWEDKSGNEARSLKVSHKGETSNFNWPRHKVAYVLHTIRFDLKWYFHFKVLLVEV